MAARPHISLSGSLTPELIVTDCGSAFIDFDTRVGATDLGINIDAGPAGMPEFRARIERLFGTMSNNFIGRFTGRTFSNTVVKGDYDAEARAALTAEDLSEALVRWVVDVYHRRPHAGLNGETPLNCWNRLVARYGVAPMPDLKLRRRALGTRLECTVSKKGISVLGVRYHSKVLGRWFMHSTKKQVRVRWYSEDLGAIAVELDGKWIEVPSVFERFRGERAQTWMLAVREIRASVAAQKKIDQEVIFRAMTRIREINANAIARQGLFVDDYSKERIEKLEDDFLIGFEVEETPNTVRMQPASDGRREAEPRQAHRGRVGSRGRRRFCHHLPRRRRYPARSRRHPRARQSERWQARPPGRVRAPVSVAFPVPSQEGAWRHQADPP